jgi:lysozyme
MAFVSFWIRGAMQPRHRVSRAAIDLIKQFEGYRRKAAKAPDGRWTIGYGHTLTAREGAVVSETEAEALLVYDLIEVAHAVNEQVFAPLSQNEFDALVSFAFNIGPEAFRASSVLRRLNAGERLQAACAMDLWRRAEIDGETLVIDALVRRRASEKALFLTPVGAWAPAPSSILKPGLDHDRAGGVPTERPVPVETPMDGDLVLLKPEAGAFPTASAASPDPAGDGQDQDLVLADPLSPANDAEVEAKAPEPKAPPQPLSLRALAPLGLLALLGAALFAGGLYWAFRFAPAVGVSPTGAMSVGWVAGVAGVVFFSLAAYRLFDRLGRAYEDDALAG